MSILKESQRTVQKKISPDNGVLQIDKVIDEQAATKKVRTYAKVVLGIGSSIDFHTHVGESESYFILKGVGQYNDDGYEYEVKCGDFTTTLSGHGHGIKNIGYCPLEFMALITVE